MAGPWARQAERHEGPPGAPGRTSPTVPPAGLSEPAPPKPKKSEVWTKIRAILFGKLGKLVALSAILGVGYYAYTIYESHQPYEWSGSVEMRTVSVGSRVGGRVKALKVREGQKVSAGQVLVVLEPGELEAKKAMAEAELAGAEARLEKLSNGASKAEIARAMSALATAQASVAQGRGHANFMDREFKRAESLYKQGAISAAERDAALGQSRSGHGSLREAVAREKEAQASLKVLTAGTRPEEIRAARAEVEAAKAKVALATEQLNELTVRAPSDARVEAIAVRPGDILRADERALSLLEAGQLYVRIYVPETRLGNIHIGQEVPVSVDAFPDRTFKGRVDHVNEVGEFTPSRLVTTEERADEVFGARISLLEGDGELKAGMAAFIHVKK